MTDDAHLAFIVVRGDTTVRLISALFLTLLLASLWQVKGPREPVLVKLANVLKSGTPLVANYR